MHQINDKLSTCVPRRIFVHHPLNGRQLGNSPRWNSPRRDPFRGPPFSPHVGSNKSNQHLIHACLCHHGFHQLLHNMYESKQPNYPYKKLQYLTYVKDIDSTAHIKVWKKAIKDYGETMEVDIINMFSFTFKNSIFEWNKLFPRSPKLHIWGIGSSLLQMVLNCENDEKVYMQLQNIPQQTIEWVKVYYKLCLLKFKNCLHVRVPYVSLPLFSK